MFFSIFDIFLIFLRIEIEFENYAFAIVSIMIAKSIESTLDETKKYLPCRNNKSMRGDQKVPRKLVFNRIVFIDCNENSQT